MPIFSTSLIPCVLSWLAGLNRLAQANLLVRVSAYAWELRAARAKRFCARLGMQAEALG